MKIYTKIKIDIETGKVLEEESFEYDGPVSLCGKGGSSPSTSYTQSPQEQQMLQILMPVIQNLAGNVQSGTSPINVPGMPDMTGVMTGAHQYMPDAGMLAPTGNWWEQLDPNIRQGIQQPFQEGSRMLTESLGGSAGSARGGASGVLGSAQSDFWNQASPQMAMSGWNMMQPSLQAGYNQGIAQASDYQSESMGNYQNLLALRGEQMSAQQFPYSALSGLTGGAANYMPTGITQEGGSGGKGSGIGSLIGGGLGYALAPATFGTSIPIGMALGGTAGGLFG